MMLAGSPAVFASLSILLALPTGAAATTHEVDVERVVREAADTVRITKFATLATIASDGSISGRVIYPKPPNASFGESPDLHFVTFATLSPSRKYAEIEANPQATLVYFDDAGKGEVTLKGVIRICNSTEAADGWYGPWKRNYPEGPATPFYALLRLQVTALEFVSYARYGIDEGSGRSDWRPLTLRRPLGGDWSYEPPPPPPVQLLVD
uniref:Pyridoxamine 5'-phosphate oxidase N-terminal domain-containing protein n=1 Tax=Alexandrium catenella TaxID=2925 RepID=A0A7S1KWU0_ALECA